MKTPKGKYWITYSQVTFEMSGPLKGHKTENDCLEQIANEYEAILEINEWI